MTNKTKFFGLAIAAAIVAACSGLLTPVVTKQQTQVVTVTNAVVRTVTLTNGVEVTNYHMVPVYSTNLTTVLLTNYVENAGVSNTVATLSTVNGLSAPVNPFTTWIAAGLGLVSAGLGWYATSKNKQAGNSASVASTVIGAIENLEPAIAPLVKNAVSRTALAKGTSTLVDATVQNLTTKPVDR